MDKYKGKYKNESTRLQNWNYGWAAAYFVTICTKDRICYFGEISNATMILSPIGMIANVLWYEIKNHTKNVELGEFVVMPNHVHGIIIINENTSSDDGKTMVGKTHVGTTHALSLPSKPLKSSDISSTRPEKNEKNIGQMRFQNQGKNSLSSIVGSNKSAVTKHVRRLGYDFVWQSRFHDYIIRNDESFQRISQYIINNPANWVGDTMHPQKK